MPPFTATTSGALPEGMSFEPLMTLYLTDDTPPEEISRARAVIVCPALR